MITLTRERSKNSNSLYRLLPTLGKASTFLNFGYWAQGDDYDKATTTLALKLGDLAVIEPTDTVLCAGCGFGDEVALWNKAYQPQSIVGINLFAPQLQAMNQPCVQADATQLPFQSCSVSKILALESAFHFQSRECFFKEAHRVLMPNGALCLADIVLKPGHYSFFQKWVITRACAFAKIPLSNQYDTSEYIQKLSHTGFEVEICRDVSKRVLNGFLLYLQRDGAKKHLVWLALMLRWVFPAQLPLTYVLVKANKLTE